MKIGGTKRTLPGRLGTVAMTLRSDPRTDPRVIEALAPLGLDLYPDIVGISVENSYEELLTFCGAAEMGFLAIRQFLSVKAPPVEGVSRRTEVIKGIDENEITLFIHQPTHYEIGADTAPLPAIVHLHGGAMAVSTAADAPTARWRDELAATQMVVIGVEFRNSGGTKGPHPFPAGLNDSASAVQWVNDNRQQLGISKIVLSGDSGGANLGLATAIKANQQGWVSIIDGVHAQCPYIAGGDSHMGPELVSRQENNQYFLSHNLISVFAKIYDPTGDNATNPLAWPFHAKTPDLVGLPPHLITVNELDPLRDEGLGYYRKLLNAEVIAQCRTKNGISHIADLVAVDAIPDVYHAGLAEIHNFVISL